MVNRPKVDKRVRSHPSNIVKVPWLAMASLDMSSACSTGRSCVGPPLVVNSECRFQGVQALCLSISSTNPIVVSNIPIFINNQKGQRRRLPVNCLSGTDKGTHVRRRFVLPRLCPSLTRPWPLGCERGVRLGIGSERMTTQRADG